MLKKASLKHFFYSNKKQGLFGLGSTTKLANKNLLFYKFPLKSMENEPSKEKLRAMFDLQLHRDSTANAGMRDFILIAIGAFTLLGYGIVNKITDLIHAALIIGVLSALCALFIALTNKSYNKIQQILDNM